ncbi:MAG: ferritin [Chitinophagales bacterium]|nr:ferritin [Chitinophagales bacterium]MDW8427089.1 ferritin [Chitinophagales bacterium]
MLSKTIEQALNQQIEYEGYASNYYLAAASWADARNLEGAARFLYRHAEEERGHMMRLFTYINDSGGHALVPAFRQPPNEFESLLSLFESLLQHELEVTARINRMVTLCLQEQDYSTHHFLQWYVAEQHEEEKLFRSIIDKIKLLECEGPRGLYWVDRELGSMKVD